VLGESKRHDQRLRGSREPAQGARFRSVPPTSQEWLVEEDFNKWWNSPEYKPWKDMRLQGADVNLLLLKYMW